MPGRKVIRGKLILTLIAVSIVLFPYAFPFSHLSAATLDAAWIRLSRMQADLDGATTGEEVIMFIAFTAERTTASNSTLTIELASDAEWCRNAGALIVDRDDATGDGLDALTEPTERGGLYDVDSYIPDGTTISAACAASGTTFTISDIGNLAAGTTYGFYLVSDTGVIGTANNTGEVATITVTNGSDIDTAIFDVELVADDTVTINATVADAPTITCVINGGGTVNLGALYRNGAANTGSHTISTTTSVDATNGYYWTVYGTGDGTDAGLYKAAATAYLITSDDIAGAGSTPGATANLNTTEGFGITAAPGAGTETIPTNFDGASAADVGYLGESGVGGAQLLLYKTSAQVTASNATVNYYGRAGGTAEVGSYTETVTLTCGLYF